MGWCVVRMCREKADEAPVTNRWSGDAESLPAAFIDKAIFERLRDYFSLKPTKVGFQ